MTSVATKSDVWEQIRARLESWAKAAGEKDLDTIMAAYLPDVVAFDAIGQLRFKGAEAYRAHWETCLSFVEGPMVFEIHDLDIAAHGDVAFCHYLVRCGCTDEKGKEQVGWMRGTTCLRETRGAWLIAHEHFSAPFDPESGKALCDLEP